MCNLKLCQEVKCNYFNYILWILLGILERSNKRDNSSHQWGNITIHQALFIFTLFKDKCKPFNKVFGENKFTIIKKQHKLLLLEQDYS